MTLEGPPVVIFDLDDTLLATNSFHRLLYSLHFMVPAREFRWETTQGAWLATLRRARGQLSRVEYKQDIQALIADDVGVPTGQDSLGGKFAHLLEARLDPVAGQCLELARGLECVTVLSTGALAEYARPLADLLKMDIAVTTSALGDRPWIENIGVAKRKNTMAVLNERGYGNRFRVLIADSRDDLPLASVCDASFWREARTSFRRNARASIERAPMGCANRRMDGQHQARLEVGAFRRLLSEVHETQTNETA